MDELTLKRLSVAKFLQFWWIVQQQIPLQEILFRFFKLLLFPWQSLWISIFWPARVSRLVSSTLGSTPSPLPRRWGGGWLAPLRCGLASWSPVVPGAGCNTFLLFWCFNDPWVIDFTWNWWNATENSCTYALNTAYLCVNGRIGWVMLS